ncbi:TPA: hypothetical protein ACQVKY_005411 [Serratia marcescens]|uniref:Uncharacterized protein n=1 Tax=Serratia nevei TaxID=2703794 RepID=A0ABT7G5M9_9GAMM|nr:hypothetical protein [Serratia nevei]HAU4290899.1 hypothetical protein [Serratia marcescens]MDK5169071.1 hypothetical protein [Serratia nevei]MDK5298565.1 hypothetical protein [Serratia nevei]MEC5887183.1 hypothetical protein [Serratia nevei]HAU4297447.1 hypothetical protein [Serratia marcescens]
MSKIDRNYFWLGIALCLFMIVFEHKLVSHPNQYDTCFYLFMLLVLLVYRLWHWAREQLHKPE